VSMNRDPHPSSEVAPHYLSVSLVWEDSNFDKEHTGTCPFSIESRDTQAKFSCVSPKHMCSLEISMLHYQFMYSMLSSMEIYDDRRGPEGGLLYYARLENTWRSALRDGAA